MTVSMYPARHFKSGDNLEIGFCNFAPNFSRPFFGGEIEISPPEAEQMGSFCGSQKWTSSSWRRGAWEPAQIGLLIVSDQILSSTCQRDWKEGVQVGKVVEYLQLPSRRAHGCPDGQIQCCSSDSRLIMAVKLLGFCSLALPPPILCVSTPSVECLGIFILLSRFSPSWVLYNKALWAI